MAPHLGDPRFRGDDVDRAGDDGVVAGNDVEGVRGLLHRTRFGQMARHSLHIELAPLFV